MQYCIISLTSERMITGDGDSASTLQTQESARQCFNAYAALNGMKSLMETSRETFCCETFFQKFAYFLTSVYKAKLTKAPLSKGTVLGYMGCILVLGKNTLFKGINELAVSSKLYMSIVNKHQIF